MKHIPMLVIPSASGPEIEICISLAATAILGVQIKIRDKANILKKYREIDCR